MARAAKRGQGSKAHLTCPSVEPGTHVSDTHGYFHVGHCASLEPNFGPAKRGQWEVVRGTHSELSSQRELGEPRGLWINKCIYLRKSTNICQLPALCQTLHGVWGSCNELSTMFALYNLVRFGANSQNAKQSMVGP